MFITFYGLSFEMVEIFFCVFFHRESLVYYPSFKGSLVEKKKREPLLFITRHSESGSSCVSLLVMFRALLTVYTPHSFCTTVFTGHDYSALSYARFTVTMSHRNFLIWCSTEGEHHAQVVMSGCIIQSG